MPWRAKENILSYRAGTVLAEIPDNWKPHFEYIPEKGEIIPVNPDLNKDGVFDKKDVSIAGQVLEQAKTRGRPKHK
jgi:hypothetical protein